MNLARVVNVKRFRTANSRSREKPESCTRLRAKAPARLLPLNLMRLNGPDMLESLFDFYYVQPALLKAKRDALNKKLAESGKPAMK